MTHDDVRKDPLLNEIRTRFSEFALYWEDNFKQGDLDILALSLDGPWDKDERERRQKEGRLCEHHDVISQYNRRMANQSRLNARGIKINPAGEKATPETAGKREDRIRQIEYESNAKYARQNALDLAIDRGMGFYIVRTDYVAPDSFDQKIVIDAILNPKSVLIWPYCKQPDRSDQQASFVLERYSHDTFRQKWPRADPKSFGGEFVQLFPQWISTKDVQVVSYFRVEMKERHLLQIQGPDGRTMKLFADELPEAKVKGKEDNLQLAFPNGNSVKILRERWSQYPSVMQYMSNGVEILDKKQWIGTMIPIICVFGPEKYGADGKLTVESATRKARSAQLAYDFAWTNQLEAVGQIPKTKVLMAEGQQETATDWENLNRTATGFATYKVVIGPNGQAVPPPIPLEFRPDIQGPEIIKQSAQNAIENAYGISSVQHQDKVAKSGRTIQKLNEQADVTNYHFQDASDRGLSLEGRMINEVLDKVEDTEAVRGFRTADGEYKPEKVSPKVDESGEIVDHPYGDAAAHDVTVSIQRAFTDQFEKATDFLDSIAQDPRFGPLLMPLIVKAKELGPIGDKMFEILKAVMPPEARRVLDPENAGPDVGQIQQQAQQLQQMLQAATQQIHELKDSIAAKDKELEAKVQMNRENNDTRVAVAEIQSKVAHQADTIAIFMQRMDHMLELIKQDREQAHAVDQQAQQLGAQQSQADQNAQLQREQMAAQPQQGAQ